MYVTVCKIYRKKAQIFIEMLLTVFIEKIKKSYFLYFQYISLTCTPI